MILPSGGFSLPARLFGEPMIHLTFEGGEHDGATLGMAAPYVPARLWVARSPLGTDLDVIIVGTERMHPDKIWDEIAVQYHIDLARSDAHMDNGAAQGKAVYAFYA